MSLQLIAQAQDLIVVDPSDGSLMDNRKMSLIPLEVVESTLENDHEYRDHCDHSGVEVHDRPMVVEVELELMPGAGNSPEPEPIEVYEVEEKDTKNDENDAKPKKNEKWDWESRGATGFIDWVKERCNDVPKHSGLDTAGLERAIAYLDRLDNEISKAMRLDLDGELDANQIEKVRATIDDGIERLQERLDKIKKNKKNSRKKRAEVEYSDDGLVKEAQKITGIQGVYITVPLLISGIARVCINGTVSAGHDIEKTFNDQVKKYKLNDREKSEVRWLLWDMGYPMRGDRGFMPDEDFDPRSSDNYDYMSNYTG